ncbi:hypothetical protein M422DRAFT_50631 [Sphaerobolus stellatus SS14]|uniref:Uncharacterized protein n=1 Tax=Sphaerobolus stellatus (strain SS14) TaxID=990650 RepID=A0A0C9V6H5_SPHS4|nr:hypothetical protein M422DRAFT_50631 [Sphaerobolus stellatus SS14]
MSSILVCRFMLDLRRYNDSEPKLPSLSLKDVLPISNQPPSSRHSSWTFHGYFGRVNELIMSEFGDDPTSYSDDDLTTAPPISPSFKEVQPWTPEVRVDSEAMWGTEYV